MNKIITTNPIGGTINASRPEVSNIQAPAELRELQGWLIWRLEPDASNPNGKSLKVPYYADGGKRHGKQGGIDDRRRMTTFAVARDAAARLGFTGVGLALMPEFGITALDLDNCVDEQGKLPPEIEQIASQTYAEYSPSGMGVRAFVRGSYGNRKSPTAGNDYGFETFTSNGFVTFTGNAMPYTDILGLEDTIADLDALVAPLCAARFGSSTAKDDPDDFMAGHEPKLNLPVKRMQELLGALDPNMGREDWIRVGMALHHECDGDDTGLELWDDWSSEGYTYSSTEGLRVQWESFERRKGSGQANITMATVLKMAKEAGYRDTGLDISDLRQQAQEVTSNLPQVDGVRTPDGYSGKFLIYAAGDPALHKSTEWHIKGVLPKADLIVLYGASGSGKSFVALDMIAAVARGTQWQGCRVKKAKVVMIAAEGSGGVGKRIRAYCKHYGLNEADLDIGIIRVPPNVIENVDVQELVNALTAVGADVFVIDTLAQVTPGANENSSDDMGKAIRNIRLITEATGATALVVHHAGKDASRGARGWSGIRAAADAEIEISCNDTGRLISITKMKDGDDSQQWGFQLNQVEVGTDDDGDIETSCVVEYVEAPPKRVKSNEPKGKVQATIMERARHCGASTSEGALTQDVIDASVGMIPFDPVQAEGKKTPRDQRRSRVMRALTTLCDQGHLITREERVYVKGFEPHYTSVDTFSVLNASASNCYKSVFEDI
jgi:primase-polymerase (primpol)-like protein